MDDMRRFFLNRQLILFREIFSPFKPLRPHPFHHPLIRLSAAYPLIRLLITARQKVLAHLKKTRAASAREIARALKMSAPNVRHHLSVLCSDGRVEFTALNNREGRGRPEKMYSLSAAALGDNLPALTNALLTEAGSRLNVDAVASRILNAGQFANLPVTKRLVLLVEKLDEMHYQARWEAGAEGPRVIFGRCPYSQVIEKHPELCKMDAALLANALNRPVSQLQKNETGARGGCPFLFRVD
jgi:predicted ArsR family transcriptional regulator